uniref:F-box domain-containing protein n=1 Tax=Aegilops tauschii TaxID=37682 RepID=M8B7Q4_AEGTA
MSQERDWSSLPVDLLILILKRLRWSSHPSIALVCRQWSSAMSPFYPVWITPLLLNTTDVGTTNVRYYSPYFQKNFEIGDTLEAPDAKICYANGRYLTLCMSKQILKVDLLTDDFYRLAPISQRFEHIIYNGMGKMFGISTLAVQVIACCMQNSDGVWEHWEYSYPDRTKFTASPGSNPVLHHGLIYLLLEDGRLAVCDERRHEEGFEILEKPRGFGFVYEDSYLIESGQGELMVVLIGRRGSPVDVFKLNGPTMEWDKMESLDGRALFTGTLTTIMKKTTIKSDAEQDLPPKTL